MDVRDALTGRLINERFRIVAPLNREAGARLYRAEQLPLGRPVALKVLDARRKAHTDEARAQFQQRFLLEASIAARLQHPNTVAVFDYGCTEDGLCFMAMEMVEGRTLGAALASDGPFDDERVVHVALQVARSLREAHRLGVVHGDLKPWSVLLTRHGDEEDFVRVCDFGLARTVPEEDLDDPTTGLFMGSPKYMSPERIRGDRCDPRADVYSLGVLMYEMLTGRVPFDRPNAVQVLMAHMQERVAPIDRPDCAQQLIDLVMQCLAKQPDGRPASMDDVIVLLKRSLGRLSLPTTTLTVTREMALGGFALPPFESQSFATQATGSQPVPAAATVPPSLMPGPSRARMFMKGAVVGLCMVGAVALALWPRSHGEPLAPSHAEPSTALGAAMKAVEAEPPTSPSTTTIAVVQADRGVLDHPNVRVRLDSSPSGALVRLGDKLYGPTPADVELWGDHVAPGRELTFVFEKSGYESLTITRIVRQGGLQLDVTLERASGSAGSGGARVASAAGVTGVGANGATASDGAEGAPIGQLEQWPAMDRGPADSSVPEVEAPLPVAAAPLPVEAAPAPAPSPAVAAPAPRPTVAQKPAKTTMTIARYSAPLREANTEFPEYPRAALRAGISGIVVTRVYVRPDGRVGGVDILEGPAVFHDGVRRALMTWRYTPARLADGTPVADTHIVRIPFQMK